MFNLIRRDWSTLYAYLVFFLKPFSLSCRSLAIWTVSQNDRVLFKRRLDGAYARGRNDLAFNDSVQKFCWCF